MSTTSTPLADSQAAAAHGASPHPFTGSSTLLLAAFAAVYVIWGSTYLAIRIGVESVPPLMLAGLRHFTVGLLLYPVLRWKTGVRPTRAHWQAAIVTGFLLLFLG